MTFTDANPLKLSVLTLTQNNEHILENTLKAVYGWAEEIIIVDSGSTDRTLDIAKKYNCKIFHRDFNGFGEQKAYAVSQVKNDWVMVVDSDEIVTDELKKEITEKIKNPGCNGFMVPITLVFMGRLMRYGHEYKMPHLRLFNRRFGNYNDARVHEDVNLEGKAGKLENHILHYSYANLNEYFRKLNIYTSEASEDLKKKGKKASSIEIVIRFPLQFIQTYILQLNFLNGYSGFIWSLCSSFYPVVKYAKLKELNESE